MNINTDAGIDTVMQSMVRHYIETGIVRHRCEVLAAARGAMSCESTPNIFSLNFHVW